MTETQDLQPPVSTPWWRRWKLIVGIVVIVLALLWLVLFLTVGGDFYQTVDEAKAAGTLSNVRVGGRVAESSLNQDPSTQEVRFVLEGSKGGRMDVVYTGPYPERLAPFQEVVVTGSTGKGGVFEATQILVKCPEKLFPEKVTNRVMSGTGLERLLY